MRERPSHSPNRLVEASPQPDQSPHPVRPLSRSKEGPSLASAPQLSMHGTYSLLGCIVYASNLSCQRVHRSLGLLRRLFNLPS